MFSNYEQIEYDGIARYNGESWCVYMTQSRACNGHSWKRALEAHLHQWREVVEPCKDYREKYCIQMDVTGVSSEKFTYRESGCVENNSKAALWTAICNRCNRQAEIKAKTRRSKCCESIAKENCVAVA